MSVSIYAIAFLAAWFAWGMLAYTRRGKRAEHNALIIWKPKGPLNSDGSTTEYAHVQEKGEARLHTILGVMVGSAFLAISSASGAGDMGQLILTFLPTILVDAFSRKIGIIDYGGHGAEIMAAEAEGHMDYRAAEIIRMSDDYDKRGDDIPTELDRYRWLARIVYTLGRW